MTTLLLVRHGETDWNRHRRVQGHSDTPLNDTGREQARALARELETMRIDAVYSSDLVRAHETARIMADRLGLDVTAVRDLRERNFGTWEGLAYTDVFERYPEAAHHGAWGDAETPDEMAERVLGGLERIAEAHPGGRVLVVTHGGPVRAVLMSCGVATADPVPNCHLVEVEIDDGSVRAG